MTDHKLSRLQEKALHGKPNPSAFPISSFPWKNPHDAEINGEWSKSSEVVMLDRGRVWEAIDATLTSSLSIYDQHNNFEVCRIVNASGATRSMYCGFEVYEDLSMCETSSGPIENYLAERCAYTGSRCLHLPQGKWSMVTINPALWHMNKFAKADATRMYALNFFYMIPAAATPSAIPVESIIVEVCLKAADGSVLDNKTSIILHASNGNYRFHTSLIDLKSLSTDYIGLTCCLRIINTGINEVYIDDLSFVPAVNESKLASSRNMGNVSPSAALVAISVYDETSRNLIAAIDSNGLTMRYVYDESNQLIATSVSRGDDLNTVTGMTNFHFSRHSYDNVYENTFNPNTPNSKLNILAQNGGKDIRFREQMDIATIKNGPFAQAKVVGDELIIPTPDESEKNVILANFKFNDAFVLRIQVSGIYDACQPNKEKKIIYLSDMQGSTSILVSCLRQQQKHSYYKVYYNDTLVSSIATDNNYGFRFKRDWLFIILEKQFYLYIGGQLIASVSTTTALPEISMLPISTDDHRVTITRVMIASDPTIAEIYLDALNQPRQRQSYIALYDNNVKSDIQERLAININEQLYDELGRLMLQTVVVEKKELPLLGFDTKFINNRDIVSWKEKNRPVKMYQLEGRILNNLDSRYDSVKSYAYGAAYYENDPLSRVEEITLPDKDFFRVGPDDALKQWTGDPTVNNANLSHSVKHYYGDFPQVVMDTLSKRLGLSADIISKRFQLSFGLKRLNAAEQVLIAQVNNLFGESIANLMMDQNSNFILTSIKTNYISKFACAGQVAAYSVEYYQPSTYSSDTPYTILRVDEYNTSGRLIKSISPEKGEAYYYYNKASQLIFKANGGESDQAKQAQDALIRVYYYEYDQLSRLKRISYFYTNKNVCGAENLTLQNMYNTDQLPMLILLVEHYYDIAIEPEGGLQLSQHEKVVNNMGRVTKSVHYEYHDDPVEAISTPALKNTIETYYSYDELGHTVRLATIIKERKLAQVVGYAYTPLGNVSKIYYPTAWKTEQFKLQDNAENPDELRIFSDMPLLVTYDYNIAGQVHSIMGIFFRGSDKQFSTCCYYNIDRTLYSETINNKVFRKRYYDTLNNLTHIEHGLLDDKIVQSAIVFKETIFYRDFQNIYLDGNINKIIYEFNKQYLPDFPDEFLTYQYSYDSFSRIKNVILDSKQAEEFEYDENFNIRSVARQSKLEKKVQYIYDLSKNRLTSINPDFSNHSYQYNNTGSATVTPEWVSSIYDILSSRLLRQVTLPESKGTVEFSYDINARRLMKSDISGYVKVYWRGLSSMPLIEQQLEDESSKQVYIYGINGPLLMSRWTTKWDHYYLLHDHLKSLRVALKRNPDLTIRAPIKPPQSNPYELSAYFRYTAFGELENSINKDQLFRYLYTGQEWDSEIGMYNYHARLYDPKIGRFLATDLVELAGSSYAYTMNNPIKLIDPTGSVFESHADAMSIDKIHAELLRNKVYSDLSKNNRNPDLIDTIDPNVPTAATFFDTRGRPFNIQVRTDMSNPERARSLVFEMTNAYHSGEYKSLKEKTESGLKDINSGRANIEDRNFVEHVAKYVMDGEHIEYKGLKLTDIIIESGIKNLGWTPEMKRRDELPEFPRHMLGMLMDPSPHARSHFDRSPGLQGLDNNRRNELYRTVSDHIKNLMIRRIRPAPMDWE